ncbi:hypothetical protein [Catenuloplanes indicus]|uniref:Immunity protein 35 domain-containing protein n=1 Tax=Catenuloplanes indicus TaxID=137267 RepID=A0AAE4B2Z9_9ACTN|nr:hypothetical protein [Catenuloplanes indicus]MDQ0371221.1 hypothetical protein [Catenuloplanes indicus]
MTAYETAASLPAVDELRRRCRALAVLDRIVGSDWPYYGYTERWGDGAAGSMSNGSGDEWTIVFGPAGAFIRVFDHESNMSPYGNEDHEPWPGLLDGLPEVFRPQVEQPAFRDEEGTFVATAVLWRQTGDSRWHAGDGIVFPRSRGPHDAGPDGTAMLDILGDDIVDRYVAFAGEHYEVEVGRAAAAHVVAHRPVTDAVVRAINPAAAVADLRDDLVAMNFPVPASAP